MSRQMKIVLGISLAAGIFGFGWWYIMTSTQSDREDVPVGSGDDSRSAFTKGDADAPVVMIEYVDILCPGCARMHQQVIPKINIDYVDTGIVRYEVRVVAKVHHQDTAAAAMGAYCAADQGKFWEYLDAAYDQTWLQYEQGKEVGEVTLFSGASHRNFARRLGLSLPEWERCIERATYADLIQSNERELLDRNAYGTPHSVINGNDYNGSPPYASFKTVIEAARSGKDTR